MRSKILLAGPTALYAPIYLAKQLTLSKEFAHIDFEYPDHPKPESDNKADELVDQLFYPYKKTNVIMAVADPMRVAFESFDNYDNKPKVIHTLINKMCYWAIAQYPEDKLEMINKNYKIIVHPRGMTGHTLVLYDLINMFPDLEKKDNSSDRNIINDLLYHKIYPGEEGKFYRASSLYKINNRNVGYVTTEPYDILDIAQKNTNNKMDKKSFIHFKNNGEKVYCNAVMTSLITSDDCLNDPIRKEILKDLILGIKEAIKFIYKEPKIASEILYNYDDTNHNFSRNKVRFAPKAFGWTESMMQMLFETILAKEKIYPSDLTIVDAEIDKSKNFWKKRFEFEGESKMLDKLTDFDSYIKKDWDKKNG